MRHTLHMSNAVPIVTDFYTRPGATILAERIESYWRSRGYRGIKTYLRRITGLGAPHWTVVTNCFNGYPPRKVPKV